MSDLAHIDVYITEETLNSCINKIAKVVKPEWNTTELELKRFDKGLLNTTILVYSHRDLTDGIVIKTVQPTYTGNTAEYQKLCRFLHAENLGPRFLATFTNGICQQYVHGESLEWETPRLYQRQVWEKIARELARWHHPQIYARAVENDIRTTPSLYFDIRSQWDDIIQQPALAEYRNQMPTTEQLFQEVEGLHQDMLERGELTPRLCHLDANPANMILTNSERGIELIDYDFTGINYAENDLAWYFSAFTEHSTPGSHHIPGKEYETDFLKIYLQAQKFNGGDVTDQEVASLYQRVQIAKLNVYLRTVVISAFIRVSHGGRDMRQALKLWQDFPQIKRRLLEDNRRQP